MAFLLLITVMDRKRTFTNVDVDGSRFVSKTPSAAAGKAYTSFCRSMKSKPKSKVITVRETTKGSAGKTYKYKVERVPLKEPVVLELGGKQVTKTFTTKVTSMK